MDSAGLVGKPTPYGIASTMLFDYLNNEYITQTYLFIYLTLTMFTLI